MPKVKPKRSNPVIDMTAMCDVSFLLLTFFILTAKFKPQSVVAVDVPTARSTVTPDNMVVIILNKEGKAFVSLKEKSTRYAMLEQLAEKYGEKYPMITDLSPNQKEFFALTDTWGTPVEDTKRVLSMDGVQFKEYQEKEMPGIPYDSLRNQLADWVQAARYATEGKIRIAIKADKNVNVEHVRQLIKRLTEKDIHRFLLITTLAGGASAESEEAKKEN
ncbi:MAG: biopolymer transporter ExbD [Chitinophagales bacterium]|nr:biopolymer transporter ExbD [Chitinophagales bacterium]MDW8418939.1 biopolymer transporter ExbD [Chitinophagales bacterium]